MRINSISFGDDGKPDTVTVTMTVAEAATVTKLTGRITPTSPETHSVWAGFTHGLFGPYWEGCAEDVETQLDADLPEQIELNRGSSQG